MISLVDAFFEHVYPMPSYAFLHPETTKRRCRQGQVHGALTSATAAIASLYLGGDRQRAGQWTDMSEQSIWLNLERPTVARLQTLLLVIHYRMETGNFQRAFMLSATAARFAAAMRLNYERPELDLVGREVRRRIVWSLKIIERYFSSGLPEFELCPTESIYIEYPSPEEDFNHGPPGENGAYRLHLRLETVRRDIMKMSRSVTILDQPLPSLMKLIRHHEASLAEIGESLPQGRTLSMAQTLDLLDNHWLPRRTLTYASWHQAHCDLYRILLPGYPEAAPAVVLEAIDPAELAAAERHLLHHATSSLQVLTTLNQQSMRQQLLEFDTAICSYHAARVLLYISRFGKNRDRPAPEFAISRADLCVAALRRFFPSSALVAPIIEELTRSVGAFSAQQQQQRQTRQPAESPVVPIRLPSTPSPPGRDDHESQLASTARVRQRLAIHSLLRRADFSDGEDDDEVTITNPVAEEMHTPKSTIGPNVPLQLSNTSLSQIGVRHSASIGSRIGVQVWEAQSVNGSLDDSPESTQLPTMSWFGPQDWEWLSGHKG
ncbi:hypothetical protein F5X68DRAFT_253960 [Plectosphaerella plurivora]|uniref:Xylanolytic transcriptional activator regulatory domain-containing protein n=1 Tax=Plectosphaerella plurivora TaxID=936078 RepID=A0A9P9A9U6_9PEZI|nr:hypothetical protein F5X68DRAFT_253960 [Plectosphaerella plurivora]